MSLVVILFFVRDGIENKKIYYQKRFSIHFLLHFITQKTLELTFLIISIKRVEIYSIIATALVQPALAPLIFAGKQATLNPKGGKAFRLANFSI